MSVIEQDPGFTSREPHTIRSGINNPTHPEKLSSKNTIRPQIHSSSSSTSLDNDKSNRYRELPTRNFTENDDLFSTCDVDAKSIHPFVYWAQSQSHISLRVDMTEAENLSAIVEGAVDDFVADEYGSEVTSSLKFSAKGTGAHGLREYQFDMDFYGHVESKLDCHPIGRYVIILIKKSTDQQSIWPRLTKQPIKLPWLRVDFDRYLADDSSDDDDDYNDSDDFDLNDQKKAYKHMLDNQRQKLNRRSSTGDTKQHFEESKTNLATKSWSDILNNILGRNSNCQRDTKAKTSNMKTESTGSKNEKQKKSQKQSSMVKLYLTVYNIVFSIVFIVVNFVICSRGLSGNNDEKSFLKLALFFKWLTYLQFLEVLHPILGLVSGGPLMPFIQATGRSIIITFLCDPNILRNCGLYGPSLLFVWSTVEWIRYPYYALKVWNIEVYPLTWLRYTAFIPLYPIGALLEATILFATIKEYERTGNMAYKMPNALNFTLTLPTVLKVYLYVVLVSGVYNLFVHMWTQRIQILSLKKVKAN